MSRPAVLQRGVVFCYFAVPSRWLPHYFVGFALTWRVRKVVGVKNQRVWLDIAGFFNWLSNKQFVFNLRLHGSSMVMRSEYEPGEYVSHPQAPDWGLGQVQSAIGARVTVMFENAGKVVIDTASVTLDRVDLRKLPPGTTF